MDLLLRLEAMTGLLLGVVAFCVLWLARPKNKSSKGRKPPEPAGCLPIMGHLHQLATSDPLPRTLGAMADKYGPAFMLRLGTRRMLIVSGAEIARDCFTTNDKALAARPKSAYGDHLSYNYAMFGFASYGPYWREMRKIATSELLSNLRLKTLMHVREGEISHCINNLYQHWAAAGMHDEGSQSSVDMKKCLYGLTFNIVATMIVGKRFFGTTDDTDEIVRVRRVMQDASFLGGVFVVSDALPFLKWMDLEGHEAAMKRTAKELDSLLSSWLQEHREKKQQQKTKSSAGDHHDFMDVMLSVLEGSQIPSYDTDTIIKATALILIEAGSDSMSSVMIWALALLMNNRHVLAKAREELDRHVGRDRHVEDSDIKSLVYLNAIVRETLRMYPPSPLGVPHEAMEDCSIAGYHIPKGTRVMVNMWRLHRDPRVWSEPNEFRPERFLREGEHAGTDVRGQHFELMPFGSGRRSCPGMPLALPVVHLTLARLIHCFDWATPSGGPVDLSERLQNTLTKAEPLDLVFKPRLNSDLYCR
ncbi:hypothetical protein ACLOJK_038787 [Asimina triloba]